MAKPDQTATDMISEWARTLTSAGAERRVLTAIAILAVAYFASRILRAAFKRLRKRFTLEAPVLYIVQQLGGYLILVIGFLAALAALGVNPTSLTVFGGAIGVGLGLGLQGVVKEFISGVVLIFDPTIQVGDFIELDGEIRGEVVEIATRATRLRTSDNLNVVIPNSVMIQSRVTNWTYSTASRRIHVPFAVAEDSDIAVVREVVMAAAKALPFTRPDDELHKTQVWLTSFSGEGLAFDLVVWPTEESTRHARTMHAAYTWAIYQALRGAGIDNANTQMDLRLRSLFGQEGEAALETLRLRESSRAAPRGPVETAPNDAAGAMSDDADRSRLQRAEPPRKRRDEATEGPTEAGPTAAPATPPPTA